MTTITEIKKLESFIRCKNNELLRMKLDFLKSNGWEIDEHKQKIPMGDGTYYTDVTRVFQKEGFEVCFDEDDAIDQEWI
jgi:hypothetical protein